MSDNKENLTDNNVSAEIAKLIAETMKINAETRWYPAIAAAGVMVAFIAVLRLFN